jgi:hypothetical protein
MFLIFPKTVTSGCAAFSDEENNPKNPLVQKELRPFTGARQDGVIYILYMDYHI